MRALLHTLGLRGDPLAHRFVGTGWRLGVQHAEEDGTEKTKEEDFRLGFHGERDARRAPLVTRKSVPAAGLEPARGCRPKGF